MLSFEQNLSVAADVRIEHLGQYTDGNADYPNICSCLSLSYAMPILPRPGAVNREMVSLCVYGCPGVSEAVKRTG